MKISSPYFLISTILTKIIILGYYHKNMSYSIKQNFITMFDNNPVDISNLKLSNKDKIELELLENKSEKLNRLYDLSTKQKFENESSDLLSSLIGKNEELYLNLINGGVIITLMTVLI